jgi:hypothetical protein
VFKNARDVRRRTPGLIGRNEVEVRMQAVVLRSPARCEHCGREYDRAYNLTGIVGSPYCDVGCNLAAVAMAEGKTAADMIAAGCELDDPLVGKMCRTVVDLWAARQALARREIARMNDL